MIEVSDTVPSVIVVRLGATLIDLNGKDAVKVSNTAERKSPGGFVSGDRLVYATWGGSTKLVRVRAADIVRMVPSDSAKRMRELEALATTLQARITKAQADLAA